MIFIIILSLFLVACTPETRNLAESSLQQAKELATEKLQQQNLPNETVQEEIVANVTEEVIVPEVKKGCVNDDECDAGKLCIDGKCGTIDEIYKTEGCEVKCNFNDIVVKTSDGLEFEIKRGRGEYSYAGALEWVIASGPDYCQGEEIIVPVKLLKKNYGKILNTQYVTVKVGEESPLVTHPVIEDVQFHFTIESVEETCE